MRVSLLVPGRVGRGTREDRSGKARQDLVMAVLVGLVAVLMLVLAGRSIARGAGTDAAVSFGLSLFFFIGLIRRVARLRRPSESE